MKTILKTFCIYITLQTISALILDYTSGFGASIASFSINILQIVLIALLYLKNFKVNKPNINLSQIYLTLIIYVCYFLARCGFQSLLIPNYIQNYTCSLSTIINVGIFAPITEEIMFRGILLNNLEQKYSFFIANLIQAFIFGVLHFSLYAFVFHLLFGILLGFIFKIFNLYCCILMHIVNNLLALYAIFFHLKIHYSKIIYFVLGVCFTTITVLIIKKLEKRTTSLKKA